MKNITPYGYFGFSIVFFLAVLFCKFYLKDNEAATFFFIWQIILMIVGIRKQRKLKKEKMADWEYYDE